MASTDIRSTKGRGKLYDSVLDTIGDTPVIRVNNMGPDNVEIYVKAEAFNPAASVKDRLAVNIIEAAERDGRLKPGQTVVEATSGNTGIGLAMVCAQKGYPLVVTMADSFSVERRRMMRMLGAKVILTPKAQAKQVVDPVETRSAHLQAYQNAALAKRYRDLVVRAPEGLRDAVAKGYHKLLAYKDEYEVARLHLETEKKARAEFDGDFRMSFHLAPPILGGTAPDGRPRKREFGPWIMPMFRILARMKGLRGSMLDPFARSAERRMERALIAQYESDMAEILPAVTPATMGIARELAELPLTIRGFGPVKEAAVEKAVKRREELLAAFREGGTPERIAAE